MLRIMDKMGKLALYCCIAVVLSSGTCTAGLLLSVAGGSVTIPEDNSIGNIVSFSVTNNLGLPVLFTSIAIDSVLYSGDRGDAVSRPFMEIANNTCTGFFIPIKGCSFDVQFPVFPSGPDSEETPIDQGTTTINAGVFLGASLELGAGAVTIVDVPEPSGSALMGLGVILWFLRRNRKPTTM